MEVIMEVPNGWDKDFSNQELVRCKDCKYLANMYKCPCFYSKEKQPDDWFCADGIAKDINVPGKEGR